MVFVSPVKGVFIMSLVFSLVWSLAADELVIYSSRKEHLLKEVVSAFEKDTGVKVKYITDKAGVLLQRMKAEGKRSPADILFTVDAGNLFQASRMGLLRPMNSDIVASRIPSHLRDPKGCWAGFSVRARTIVYNKNKVKPSELSSYEALAEDKWRGRLILRTSKKVYNQSLVAMMIARLGEARTEQVVKGWVNNLAGPVQANDTKAMKAVAAGMGDITIVNTYYFGRLMRENPELPLEIFWAGQSKDGTHVNISGAGICKYTRNVALATQFLEWLSGESAQKILAESNMEFPANPNVEVDRVVAAWGSFKKSVINVSEAGRLQAKAVKVMDRAGYR